SSSLGTSASSSFSSSCSSSSSSSSSSSPSSSSSSSSLSSTLGFGADRKVMGSAGPIPTILQKRETQWGEARHSRRGEVGPNHPRRREGPWTTYFIGNNSDQGQEHSRVTGSQNPVVGDNQSEGRASAPGEGIENRGAMMSLMRLGAK